MNSVKMSGKTIEEALRYALAKLGAKREEVKIDVIQEPTKKFLGLLGSKEAIIEVSIKTEDDIKAEIAAEKELEKQKIEEAKKEMIKKEVKKPEVKKVKVKKEEVKEVKLEVKQEIKEPKKENKISEENLVKLENEAENFLTKVLLEMGIESKLKIERTGKNLYINIEGNDMALIIGRRGQTLDSLQYITSLAVNRDKDDYIRILLDSENYRAKRKKILQSLARKLAKKAKHNQKDVVLEPMNPYERRIIHSTLQGIFGIKTISKGTEPYRKVVICYDNKTK